MSIPEFLYTVILSPPPLRRLANLLLCSIIPPTKNILGATVALNKNDPVVSGAIALGLYECNEMAFFTRNFQPGMTFLDVGANIGLYTALAISRQASTILSIEPHPESFQVLKKTIQLNPSPATIHAIQAAAGHTNGQATLHCNPQNKGDNRLAPDSILNQPTPTPLRTLDSLCQQHHINQIHFLKLDVQGAEGLVLQGATQILAQSPRCIIITEFWPKGLLACGTAPDDFLANLASPKRRIFELRDHTLRPANLRNLTAKTPGRHYRTLIASHPDAILL